jgi:FMN reductase
LSDSVSGTRALRILGVIGSPRSDSTSAALVDRVLASAAALGADTVTCDLRVRPLPFFDPVASVGDPAAAAARELARWADAFVLGTPDYHGAPSGALKNFLDHLWRELAGKLFAIVVASNEKGLSVQDHLRTSIRQCYGWALPYGAGAPAAAVADDGSVADPRLAERLDMMACDLVAYGTLLRDRRLADLAAASSPRESGFMARRRTP